MPMRFSRPLAVFACALAPLFAAAPRAHAQPQPPFGSVVFAFPGSFAEPSSGASAGRALADRWLGDDVFHNPVAAARTWRVTATPVLLHSSRQDLRADNTDFDETSAFLDLASAAIGRPLWTWPRAWLGCWAYVARTVARSEENAFVLGRNLDPLSPGATIESETSERETAYGGAIGYGTTSLAFGFAGEWVTYDAEFRHVSESGSPTSGERRTSFDGVTTAVRAGARWQSGEDAPGQVAVGAAVRRIESLPVEGIERWQLVGGAGENAVTAEREASVEGGASAAWRAGDALRLFAGAGGLTERAWQGFGVGEGARFEWSAAAEYREPAGPLALRLGFGAESGGASTADRATRLGLGAGWSAEGTTFEIGLLHRALHRDGAPDSYEDRVLATVRWAAK